MIIINPATEDIICDIPEDTLVSITTKHELILRHQQSWQQIDLLDRIVIIKRFSALLAQHIDSLAAILTNEVGKPLKQSRNEINGAIGRIEWMTDNAEKYLSDEIMLLQPGLEERIAYEPLGIVCNISAWNYPYLVGVNVIIPALLAGNGVLYKPSEHATLTGLQIEKLLKEAGVPDAIFQVVIGRGEVGQLLLGLPLDGYFFTGSYSTGKYIYEAVAHKMVVCQLEMGGKDSLYVTDDVEDIKAVAEATADGAFYNNGQSCCAVERIYVHERLYDAYVEAFRNVVESWKIGSPEDDDTYFGPITRPEQLTVLQQQLNDAVAKGATILAGGSRLPMKGFYFAPTILINVDHTMQVMIDESFGPLIGIMKVANDTEAVALMQDSKYGLTASVYSKDRQRAENIFKQLDTGSCYFNCCDRVSAALPWSGRKQSGFGATLSHVGLRAFTKPKAFHLKK